MSLNNFKEGGLKEIFDALEEAFRATDIDYYLIGAQARDIWYAKGGKISRQTKDIDFAVLAGSLADYQSVREYLKSHNSFAETKGNSFVMLTPDGIQVDIFPFGEIEIDDGVEIAGEGLTSIKVNGFKEVYQSGTEELETQTGHFFKVASLPAIVLLKLIAFDDRPEKRMKDALDIASILNHFFDLQADLIYEKHNDLFGDDTVTLEEISASVIGREIKKIVGGNTTLLHRLINILEGHIAMKEKSAFLRSMIGDSEATIENKIKLLQSMHTSLRTTQ